uniref:Uncharacterized protein n=1 Tax=Arundo donax TaxID=35708 RepID=A0A0A9FSI4_ARUDO
MLPVPCYQSSAVLKYFIIVASCSLQAGLTWTPCEPSRSSRRRRPCAGYIGRSRTDIRGSTDSLQGLERMINDVS